MKGYTISKEIVKNTIEQIINEIKSYLYESDDIKDKDIVKYERIPTNKEYEKFYKELLADCYKKDKLIKEFPLIKIQKENNDNEILLFCKTYIDKSDDYINVCCEK